MDRALAPSNVDGTFLRAWCPSCRGLRSCPGTSPRPTGLCGLRARAGSVMQLDRHLIALYHFYFDEVVDRLDESRVCALSSRTTDCRIFRRPSVRRLSRCFQRAPMVLRVW